MGSRAAAWSAIVALAALASSAPVSASVIVAGGKHLQASSALYTGDKVITGGGEAAHVYQFTFDAPFRVDGVIVRMEDERGREIAAGPGQGITGVDVIVATKPEGKWARCGATKLARPSSTGSLDLTAHVPARKAFRVNVEAKAMLSAVRFTLAFATRIEGISRTLCNLDTVVAGDSSIIARPVLSKTTGLLLRIKNRSSEDLTFGRFELTGGLPGIADVRVPGKSPAVEVDGKRAFTIRGDRLAPSETIEVYITFEKAADASGALTARLTRA